ncbi:MAG: 50S ribosomal protein L15e [Nitrososphaeria archaeon]
MGLYQYLDESWHRLYSERPQELKEKLIEWRREPRVLRVEVPTRLDKARRVGYRAKQGIVVVRVRVPKGGMRRQRPNSGRRQKALGTVKIKGNYSSREVAERRAKESFPNMEVLGSYYLAEDGRYRWYEVVMADPNHPAVRGDRKLRRALGSRIDRDAPGRSRARAGYTEARIQGGARARAHRGGRALRGDGPPGAAGGGVARVHERPRAGAPRGLGLRAHGRWQVGDEGGPHRRGLRHHTPGPHIHAREGQGPGRPAGGGGRPRPHRQEEQGPSPAAHRGPQAEARIVPQDGRRGAARQHGRYHGHGGARAARRHRPGLRSDT